jgi:hypothetical protein
MSNYSFIDFTSFTKRMHKNIAEKVSPILKPYQIPYKPKFKENVK